MRELIIFAEYTGHEGKLHKFDTGKHSHRQPNRDQVSNRGALEPSTHRARMKMKQNYRGAGESERASQKDRTNSGWRQRSFLPVSHIDFQFSLHENATSLATIRYVVDCGILSYIETINIPSIVYLLPPSLPYLLIVGIVHNL